MQRSRQTHAEQPFSPVTPRRSRKKVRFSDPGPLLQHDNDKSTGLTPVLLRTSLDGINTMTRTPTHRARRQSTPTLRLSRSYDYLSSFDTASPEHIIQFTPFREILDLRTQRRIRRAGLSDEMNKYERERREKAKHKDALRKNDAELAALRKELNDLKKHRFDDDANTEAAQTASRAQVEHLEAQIRRLKDRLYLSAHNIDLEGVSKDGEDAVMINAGELDDDGHAMVSNSPASSFIDNLSSPASETPLVLARKHVDADTSTQVDILDNKQESEILALSRDLEAAKEEKRALFNACRALPHLNGSLGGSTFRLPSPPPDFLGQIVPILSSALSRASDAANALGSAKQRLLGLGFQGDSVDEIISEMRSHFRSARLDLERAAPGETANVGLEDGCATLGALVKRIKLLIESMGKERGLYYGSLGREKALRGQFDALLVRYDEALEKIRDLEQETLISSNNMLHTTVKMEELERSRDEQTIEINRLNEALSRYHDEAKRLEALVTGLEAESAACKEKHSKEISDLNSKIASEVNIRHVAESIVAERETRIHELEEIVQDNRIKICDMTAHIEAIEIEYQLALESQQRKAAERQDYHDQEMGFMNVRISELTTSLEAAKSEVGKLCRQNSGLEQQLQLEIKAKNDLMHEWIATQTRAFVSTRKAIHAEQHSAKIREENNKELLSDNFQSDIRSEPITPVSMTRYVDVEIGRGKDRQQVNSGIEFLMEGDLIDDDDDDYVNRQIQNSLNSDIELPSSDPVNL
ncbi:hypothetical protein MPDQ_000554 [Monascus purpureus]|uniref:Uncharacterized protein n=1 Tax=Monascus purpureus TaxID=5098 RepID=A0A507R4I2_MONPU|nr:hypothetical protein MPDQ_000554 [Monascus purpureus]